MTWNKFCIRAGGDGQESQEKSFSNLCHTFASWLCFTSVSTLQPEGLEPEIKLLKL